MDQSVLVLGLDDVRLDLFWLNPRYVLILFYSSLRECLARSVCDENQMLATDMFTVITGRLTRR